MTSSRSDEVEDLTKEVINHPHFRTALEESVARRAVREGHNVNRVHLLAFLLLALKALNKSSHLCFGETEMFLAGIDHLTVGIGGPTGHLPVAEAADRLEYLQVAGCLRFRPARKK